MATNQNGYDLPENTMEYHLFPRIQSKFSRNQTHNFLVEQINSYIAHLSKYLIPYIWQYEPFRLIPNQETDIPCVSGRTNYGDNVEDEWFIVYLLTQLSIAFSGLVIKIGDTDGEILMIEAAHSLPRGLNPETAENRVFISCGKVHIVPQPMNEREASILPSGSASLEEGVNVVRSHPNLTVANRAVQNDITNRIQGYPSKLSENVHKTHAYIPAPLAAVLDHSPHLISPITQAFYCRDPIDLKCCTTMKHFRPGTRVMREVQMTRCLYAQLIQQRFAPERRGGWNIPAANNPNFRSYDIGMKLAHGAEILCSRCSGDASSGTHMDYKQQSYHDAAWQRFLSSLRDKGYFKNEIEGSKKHTSLMEDARRYYYSNIRSANNNCEKSREIMKVLKNVDYDIEKMRQEEKQLGLPDDDSWMDVTPSQLDAMLASAVGRTAGTVEPFDVNSLADAMKSFVDAESGIDGAEFPSTDNSRQGSEEPGETQFESGASMIHSMQKMFEFDDEESDSSTDMSGYSSDEDLMLNKKPSRPPPTRPPRRGKQTQQSYSTQNGGTTTNGTHNTRRTPGGDVGGYLGLDDYMKQMDQELSTTEVGKSFVKEERSMHSKSSTYTSGYKKGGARPISTMSTDIDDLDDDFTPVNVDMNLVQNMMASMDSQQGAAGPTSNIVSGMGMQVPHRPLKK